MIASTQVYHPIRANDLIAIVTKEQVSDRMVNYSIILVICQEKFDAFALPNVTLYSVDNTN
ncbi:hypothetical protein [Moorena sp. SIO4G3]|uniref:hypothetical protein n=1 Tax=Moorena sp. SIO4G3 TaxID=2607821 RepID=UPI0025E96C3B|nr:hypothetical protein [Moorena sp. SIO4G3]